MLSTHLEVFTEHPVHVPRHPLRSALCLCSLGPQAQWGCVC